MLELFQTLELSWRHILPSRSQSPLFKVTVGSFEVAQGLVSNLLAIVADAELGGPGANLADSLFELLDVAHVHLGHLAMNIDNPARFIEVMVGLPKDRPCCLLEFLIRLSESFRGGELLLHEGLQVANVGSMVNHLRKFGLHVSVRYL